MREQTTFHSELKIGQRVNYTTRASWGEATGSGIYLGVALDEEDRVPYHYFVDGEINGHPQGSHGFPAAPDTPTTTDLTPTQLIRQAQRPQTLVLVVRTVFADDEPDLVENGPCGARRALGKRRRARTSRARLSRWSSLRSWAWRSRPRVLTAASWKPCSSRRQRRTTRSSRASRSKSQTRSRVRPSGKTTRSVSATSSTRSWTQR